MPDYEARGVNKNCAIYTHLKNSCDDEDDTSMIMTVNRVGRTRADSASSRNPHQADGSFFLLSKLCADTGTA